MKLFFRVSLLKIMMIIWVQVALFLGFFPTTSWADPPAGALAGKTFKVGVIRDFPPLYMVDGQSQPYGFAIDLLTEIAREKGFFVDYVISENWGEAAQLVREGEVDFIPGFGINEYRQAEFEFSVAMETIPVSCFVRKKDTRIERVEDLAIGRYKTAVIVDGSAFVELEQWGGYNLVAKSSLDQGLNALLAGEVDAFIFPEPVLLQKLRAMGLEDFLSIVGEPLISLKRGYLFRKSDAHLVESFNAELSRLIASPYYSGLVKKWYGEPEPFWSVSRVVLSMSALLGVFAVFFVAWNNYTIRKGKAELQESNEMIRLLLDSTAEAIYGLDHEGNCTFCNAACVRMLGYENPDQLIGRNMHYLIHHSHPEGRPMPGHECSLLADISKENHDNALFWRADGTSFPVEYWSHPIFRDGKVLGMVASFWDISDRQKAEAEKEQLQAQLVQAQKMETVGRLAGGVAHDFNNMLTVIIGNIELAKGHPGLDDDQQEMLQEALAAARRSADITRQLLAFARKQMAVPRVLDLNETVQVCLKMIWRLIGEDIDLEWQPAPALRPVKIDPTQIDQIITNLCLNARDAIAGAGRITIATENVTLDESDCARHQADRGDQELLPGCYVLLTVSDDGCGMDAKTISHLFEPFFTTKEVGQGTGLGLPTIYGIVLQNNGLVQVESEPGRGTTFKIHLPCHDAPSAPALEEKKEGWR